MNRQTHPALPVLALLLAILIGAATLSAGGGEILGAGPAAGAESTAGGKSAGADPGHDGAETPGAVRTTSGAEAVPGEVVVTYRGRPSPATVSIPEDADPERAADRIDDHPNVTSASPNYVARISGWRPNDPGVNPGRRGRAGRWVRRQWNFLPCLRACNPASTSTAPQSAGGMNVNRAWRHLRQAGRPGAAGVRVAVLDTGIAYRNLGRRFRRNPDLARRRFLPGYDFVNRNRLPLDRHGHGTHIASTIAQTTNNRMGLTGIAYRARLIPVRVMDANGRGTTINIAKGIRWAANQGARVVTMSLNFSCGAAIPAVERALKYAYRKGVVLVGSSGNRPAQACPSLPATAPQVISVGGTTESGCVANYSYRSDAIDIAAPGGGSNQGACPINSRHRPILQIGMLGGNPRRFGIEAGWQGTSMAAAHVAGAAAAVIASKVLTAHRGPARVRQRLFDTARLPDQAVGDPASGFGAGIINLGRATDPRVQTTSASE